MDKRMFLWITLLAGLGAVGSVEQRLVDDGACLVRFELMSYTEYLDIEPEFITLTAHYASLHCRTSEDHCKAEDKEVRSPEVDIVGTRANEAGMDVNVLIMDHQRVTELALTKYQLADMYREYGDEISQEIGYELNVLNPPDDSWSDGRIAAVVILSILVVILLIIALVVIMRACSRPPPPPQIPDEVKVTTSHSTGQGEVNLAFEVSIGSNMEKDGDAVAPPFEPLRKGSTSSSSSSSSSSSTSSSSSASSSDSELREEDVVDQSSLVSEPIIEATTAVLLNQEHNDSDSDSNSQHSHNDSRNLAVVVATVHSSSNESSDSDIEQPIELKERAPTNQSEASSTNSDTKGFNRSINSLKSLQSSASSSVSRSSLSRSPSSATMVSESTLTTSIADVKSLLQDDNIIATAL